MTPTGLTLDAGVLIAVERGDGRVRALLRRAVERQMRLAVPAAVLAQVWRDGARQVRLARMMASPEVEIVDLDADMARMCGVLLGRRGARDVVDASVVVCARRRQDAVVTSDADDLRLLDPGLPVITI